MRRLDTARRIILLIWLAASLGCGPADRKAPQLETVPRPEITAAEPQVREQLTEARRELDARLQAQLAAEDEADPGLGPAFGRMGLLYHGYDLLEPAEACYRNARQLEPQNRDWAYLLGLVLQRRGRLAEAAANIEAALDLQPDDGPALLHLGQIEQNRNRLTKAQSFFEQALRAEPACHTARFGLAEVAASQGDLRTAADLYLQVLRDQPEAEQVHYPLAQVLLRLGRKDEAQIHLDRVADRRLKVGGKAGCPDPLGLQLSELRTGSAAAVRRGLQLGLAGGGTQELELLRQAVEENPQDSKGRLRLGSLLLGRGELEAASEQFTEAASHDPENPEINSALGVALMRMGRADQAEEQFRRALAIHPDSSHYQLQLAAALQRQDACAEAVDLYAQVLANEPAHAQALLERGLCLGKLGRISEAGRDMSLLLQFHPPEDPAQHLRLASMLFSLGEEERAVSHFEAISTSDAPAEIRAQAHILIGRVRLLRGDTQAAELSFRAASALDPNLPQPPVETR
jgi:tetratricopeptide (TPR) repeat protein